MFASSNMQIKYEVQYSGPSHIRGISPLSPTMWLDIQAPITTTYQPQGESDFLGHNSANRSPLLTTRAVESGTMPDSYLQQLAYNSLPRSSEDVDRTKR
jgi:hypothetical protein